MEPQIPENEHVINQRKIASAIANPPLFLLKENNNAVLTSPTIYNLTQGGQTTSENFSDRQRMKNSKEPIFIQRQPQEETTGLGKKLGIVLISLEIMLITLFVFCVRYDEKQATPVGSAVNKAGMVNQFSESDRDHGFDHEQNLHQFYFSECILFPLHAV